MAGLADRMAQQAPQTMQEGMPSVEDIMVALQQGADPAELIQAGVPEALIMEAISLLEQTIAAEQGQVPTGEPGDGLARMLSAGQ